MTWAVINISLGLLVSLMTAYKLGAMPQKFNAFEMIGMGLISAGCLLSIGPIVSRITGQASWFDDWSLTVIRVGLLVYFIGRMIRHWWANMLQKRSSAAHLKSRGKL